MKLDQKNLLDKLEKLYAFYGKHRRMPSQHELRKEWGYSEESKSISPVRHVLDKFIANEFIKKDDKGKLLPGAAMFEIPVIEDMKQDIPKFIDSFDLNRVKIDFINPHLAKNLYAINLTKITVLGNIFRKANFLIIKRIIRSKKFIEYTINKSPKNRNHLIFRVKKNLVLGYLTEEDVGYNIHPLNTKLDPIPFKSTERLLATLVAAVWIPKSQIKTRPLNWEI